MNKLTLIILSFIFMQCQGQKDSHTETAKEKELRQDALIEKYVYNCAKNSTIIIRCRSGKIA